MKRGSTRSHYVEEKFLKELWTCHKKDYIMNELQITAAMNFDALHPIVLWKISSNLITAITHNSLLNPTVYARCASHAIPSSGIKVHHLKPKWTCVKSALQFVRSHKFYDCNSTGLLWIFYSISFYFVIKTSCKIFEITDCKILLTHVHLHLSKYVLQCLNMVKDDQNM
jgi:hypothetical protein